MRNIHHDEKIWGLGAELQKCGSHTVRIIRVRWSSFKRCDGGGGRERVNWESDGQEGVYCRDNKKRLCHWVG